MISSGADGEVWGVGVGEDANNIYRRDGVTKNDPTGSKWLQVEGNLTQVDVFGGTAWGIDSLNVVWKSDMSGRILNH